MTPVRIPQIAAPAAAALLAALAGCGTVPHALDDLKSVHSLTMHSLDHRYEVERYGWFEAVKLWGFLKHFPGLGGRGARAAETLESPSDFCYENVAKLKNADFGDILESADVVFWAGAVAEADASPLSRCEGARVLRRVLQQFHPEMSFLEIAESEYLQATRVRMERIVKLQEISDAGALTGELRIEYIKTVRDLQATPFFRASETRGISRTLALHCAAETDREARVALATAAGVLLARGALQQIDRSLSDAHEMVRVTAAREFAAAYGPEALPRIIKKLGGDEKSEVRAAVAALAGDAARIGSQESEPVIEYLAFAARDAEAAVSVNAMESLGRLTGVGRVYDQDWWRRWWEKHLLEKPAAR